MLKLALLANPESGSGAAEEVERLLREQGAEVTRYALDELDDARVDGPERIAVAGGDGTVGCAAELAARCEVALAVIPTGTANDFARALDLPRDLEPACRLAVSGSATRALDLARIDGRPFVNAASAGLSPLAARRAGGLKGALGPLAYTVGAVHAGLTAQPLTCRVVADGAALFHGPAWQVSVASTGAFGGGSELAGDSSDGKLDVVVLEARRRTELVRRAYGMRVGRVEDQDGVLHAVAERVEVGTDGRGELLGFNVDGELIESAAAEFTVEARAFEVVVG